MWYHVRPFSPKQVTTPNNKQETAAKRGGDGSISNQSEVRPLQKGKWTPAFETHTTFKHGINGTEQLGTPTQGRKLRLNFEQGINGTERLKLGLNNSSVLKALRTFLPSTTRRNQCNGRTQPQLQKFRTPRALKVETGTLERTGNLFSFHLPFLQKVFIRLSLLVAMSTTVPVQT